MNTFKRTFPKYYHHLKKYKNSLLTKIYSAFEYDKLGFIVMGNIFQTNRNIDLIYDLKGII
jgi:hypothetical protein